MRAIGASYLIRQTAGSERLGGLRVTIRPRSDNEGSISVEATDWRTGDPLEYPDEIAPFASEAVRGIREVGERYRVPMDTFDVVVRHFIYHPVDSAPICYYQAGKSAFRSALEAWATRDLTKD